MEGNIVNVIISFLNSFNVWYLYLFIFLTIILENIVVIGLFCPGTTIMVSLGLFLHSVKGIRIEYVMIFSIIGGIIGD